MEDKKLCLLSPYGGPQAVYNWPMWPEKLCSKPDGSIEIIETIRWSFEDLPDLREAIKDELTEFTIIGDMKSYDSMKNLCEKYNSALREILDHAGPLRDRGRASVGLLKHILTKSYNQAVEDPEKLNEYKSWSPEVYGETSFDFIAQLLDTVTLSQDDVFIDLGSGVGQVVLQVAASVGVKVCVGIEKADVPFRYSQQLDRHFRFWMEWFGKTYSDYKLEKGDFFEHRFRKTITNATVIFVNNYAFGPQVDHELKIMFEDLKDGARIFSSKAFSPVHFRITDRSLNDIGSVLNVRELQPAIKGSVSWTDNSVSYYCHTVDRTKLERYFNSMKNSTKKPEQEKAAGRRPRSHGSHGSDTSTDSSNDSIAFSPSTSAAAAGSTGRGKEQRSGGSSIGHNNNCTTSMKTSPSPGPVFYGPTTRRAWKEQTSEPSKQVSASAPQDSGSGPEQNGKNGGAGSERHAEKETPAKCADKWTCRKQAKERQPSDRTAASSGNEENENQAVTANLTTGNQKKQRGRPRKDASGVAAAAAKAVRRASKNGAVKVPGVNEPARRPGRPPKKKTDASVLDTLHEQTLLSIHNRSGKRLSPAPGCVDTLLVSKLSGEQQEPHTGVPSVIIADSSDLSVNEKLDQIMCAWKQAMQQFLSYMQETLTKQIEEEKEKRDVLEKQVQAMERSVKSLQEKGSSALKAKLSELGITATTSDGVLSVSRSLITQNKLLVEKEAFLQAQVAREENLYQQICKFYDRDLRDKRMDNRLCNEIATSMEKKRRLSADVEKMENSVSNLEKFSLPLASCAGTTPSPSPTTSTLSSLGSISPKRTPDANRLPAAKSCPSLPVPRVPQQSLRDHHKQSPRSLVPNANDQVSSLIVAELNSSSSGGSRTRQPTDVPAKAKELKPKKETKKRERVSLKREAKSQATLPVTDRSQPPLPDEPLCAAEADKGVSELRAKPYDLSDAKISIKSPRGSPKCRTSSPGGCPTAESGAESRPGSQSAGTSSDKERLTLTFVINRENNSASVKSPIKDGGGSSRSGAAERSPSTASSSSAKNSPKSEPTKRKLSVTSCAKKKKHRSSRSSGPDTSSESETKLKIKFGAGGGGGMGDDPVVGPAVAQSPADAGQRLSDQSVGGGISRRPESSFERLLEIAASEREQNNRLERERRQALDSVTTVPSSTSSSTHVSAAAPPATTLYSDLSASGKRSNPPSLTPDRPIAPSNRQQQQDVSSSPLFSHLYQQQPPMSSLQSMKNLASMTLSPALHPVSEQAPGPPPKRKPGRPPKKSISAESWVPGPSSSSCMLQQQQQAKTLVSSTIPPAHGSSSFPSCQMSDQYDRFAGSHNDSIDYSVMKGGRSSGGSGHPSSVIQSSSGGRAPPPSSSSSPSFPGNNYYSHPAYARSYAGNLPAAGPTTMTGSAAAGHASVIRRHDSAPFPQPPGPYYGMISQPYPAFPMDSFQKELQRINMIQQSMDMSASPKKLLRPSPLDSVCRR